MTENSGANSGSAPNAGHDNNQQLYHWIYAAGFCLLFSVVDFVFLWPESHLAALLTLAAAASLVAIYELHILKVRREWIVLTVILLFAVAFGAYWKVGPVLPPETANNGWLVPANDPTPKTACTPDGDSAAGWFFVTIAGGGVYTVNPKKKLIAISVGGHPTITMERSDTGIMLDVSMLNASGALAVRIDKNEWTTSPSQTFRASRPDRSTLVVEDLAGNEMLSVRYMNPYTVKIRGTFYKSGDTTPVVITDTSISLGHMQLFMAPMMTAVPFVPCFVVGTEDFRDAIFTFQ